MMAYKYWWQSKTIWAAVATLAATIAGVFGLAIDAGEITEIATAVVAVITTVITIWGRVKADKKIG